MIQLDANEVNLMQAVKSTDEDIQELLDEQASSGLSVEEFCKQRSLNGRKFVFWIKKYRDAEVDLIN